MFVKNYFSKCAAMPHIVSNCVVCAGACSYVHVCEYAHTQMGFYFLRAHTH